MTMEPALLNSMRLCGSTPAAARQHRHLRALLVGFGGCNWRKQLCVNPTLKAARADGGAGCAAAQMQQHLCMLRMLPSQPAG